MIVAQGRIHDFSPRLADFVAATITRLMIFSSAEVVSYCDQPGHLYYNYQY